MAAILIFKSENVRFRCTSLAYFGVAVKRIDQLNQIIQFLPRTIIRHSSTHGGRKEARGSC